MCTGGVYVCVLEVCACVYWRCVHVCVCTGGVCMCVLEVCACVYWRCVRVCTGGVISPCSGVVHVLCSFQQQCGGILFIVYKFMFGFGPILQVHAWACIHVWYYIYMYMYTYVTSYIAYMYTVYDTCSPADLQH